MRLYGNSHGLVAGYPSSYHSVSCSVIARDDGGMQRDYWYDSGRVPDAIADPASIGRRAAERSGFGPGDRLTASGFYHRLDIVGIVEPRLMDWNAAGMIGVNVQSGQLEQAAEAIPVDDRHTERLGLRHLRRSRGVACDQCGRLVRDRPRHLGPERLERRLRLVS